MLVSFNIGSAIDGIDNSITPLEAVQMLHKHGFSLVAFRIAQSDSETTYVIQANFLASPAAVALRLIVHGLCEDLEQDAIAYKVGGTGFLVGPKAADWGGEFNPEYFIL